MKILQVINNLDVGGAETLLSAYALNSRENTSVILTLVSSDSWIKSDLENAGVKVIDLALYDKYRFIGAIRGIANVIVSEKPDIVHAHLFPPQYYLAFLRLFFRKIPFVFSEHSTSNPNSRKFYSLHLKPEDGLNEFLRFHGERTEDILLFPGQWLEQTAS